LKRQNEPPGIRGFTGLSTVENLLISPWGIYFNLKGNNLYLHSTQLHSKQGLLSYLPIIKA
jgi:hypothetical protein